MSDLRVRGRCWSVVMFFKWWHRCGVSDAWEAFRVAWKVVK